MPQKPTRPVTPAKNVEGDFGKFTDFMKRLVQVPHDEIKAKLAIEKLEKERRRTSMASASHASHAKG